MKGWRGPSFAGEYPTLGPQVLRWWVEHLPSPSDPTGKSPFVPTPEQARFLLRLYAIDPLTSRPLVRRAQLEMAKGWGKSPLAAGWALAELRGPVVFDGWDAAGEPVGRPWGSVQDSPPPWVQIAAVSEDQTDNTYSALYSMLVIDDARLARDLNIDQGRTRLYLPDMPGARLEPVTASYGTREGQRVTAAVLDETFLWDRRNSGIRLARTIRRNVAKMSGRTLETTNAPILGSGSVAEQTSEDTLEPGVLHVAGRPSHEPQPDWTPERMRAALTEVYGDSRWIDLSRVLAEIDDPATDWSDNLRFYFNTRSSGALRAVDARHWATLARTIEVPDGATIGLGFDGSVSRDATFLRGCTAEGHGFTVAAWVRPEGAPRDWHIDRTDVEQVLEHTFERYRVGLLLYDPPFWRTEGESWARRWGKERVVQLDTNQARRFAPAVDRWRAAIAEGTHTHDGDALTTAHILASRLRAVRLADGLDDGRAQYVLVKGEEGDRIDGAVADVLAYQAAMTMEPVATIRQVGVDDLVFGYLTY